MRFIPDPTHEGQQEFEADCDASPGEVEQWRALLQLLSTETADPSDCYYGLWEGWGFPESARRWPTFGVPRGAHIARSFYLFHGALSDAEIWGQPAQAADLGPGRVLPEAARQHWCGRLTTRGASRRSIDPHWAGIGASVPVIDRLVADRRLDAVAADPDSEQPAYR